MKTLFAISLFALTGCAGPGPATWNNYHDPVAKVAAQPAPEAPSADPGKPTTKPAAQKPAADKPAGFTKPANPQRPLATRSPQAPR